jgi:hypothetical protein
MGSAPHDANVTLLAKRQDLVGVGNILGCLAGIAKTGQTICSNAGNIVFQDSNNGGHV